MDIAKKRRFFSSIFIKKTRGGRVHVEISHERSTAMTSGFFVIVMHDLDLLNSVPNRPCALMR